jgi:quercetin dioxygenase-like cupin family protein
MAQPGDVIEHPSFGARMTFLETSEQTNGDLLRIEVVLPPGFSMAEHVHPHQEERHEVLSGTLRGRIGGQERDYKAGERAVGPPGVPHAWRNPSDHEDLRMVSEHRPVSHMEHMLESGFAIARDFEADKKGVLKHLLRAAILMDEVKDDFYFTGAPMRTLMAVFVALAPVGRLFGYGTGYPEDRGREAAVRSGERRGTPPEVVAGTVVASVLVVLVLLVLRRRLPLARGIDPSRRTSMRSPYTGAPVSENASTRKVGE